MQVHAHAHPRMRNSADTELVMVMCTPSVCTCLGPFLHAHHAARKLCVLACLITTLACMTIGHGVHVMRACSIVIRSDNHDVHVVGMGRCFHRGHLREREWPGCSSCWISLLPMLWPLVGRCFRPPEAFLMLTVARA